MIDKELLLSKSRMGSSFINKVIFMHFHKFFSKNSLVENNLIKMKKSLLLSLEIFTFILYNRVISRSVSKGDDDL